MIIAKIINAELIIIFFLLPNLSEKYPNNTPNIMSAIHLNPTINPAIVRINSVDIDPWFILIKNGVIVAIANPFDVNDDENLKNDNNKIFFLNKNWWSK